MPLFQIQRLSSVLNFQDQDTSFLPKPLSVSKIDNNSSVLSKLEEKLNSTRHRLELPRADLSGTRREMKTRSRQTLQKITLKV